MLTIVNICVTIVMHYSHFKNGDYDMKVAKGILKSKMLEYFRDVEKSGEELIVTDNGKPVLKVVPYKKKSLPDDIFADLRGKMKVNGDINEPVINFKEWNALK